MKISGGAEGAGTAAEAGMMTAARLVFSSVSSPLPVREGYL